MKKFYTEQRPDIAKVISQKATIIEFDTKRYYDIIQKTQLSAAEKKVEFLIRYVPNFRKLDRKIIEDYEIYFQKEVATKGYPIIKFEEMDDYIFFIYRGTCKILYPTE